MKMKPFRQKIGALVLVCCLMLPGLIAAEEGKGLSTGSLSYISRGRLQILTPAMQLAEGPLMIYGLGDMNSHERAMQLLPGQSVQLMDTYWEDASQLGQQLSSGISDIDVLWLGSEKDEVQRMMDKGYLMDLSGSAAIREHLQRCYPLISASAQKNSAIYLLPVSLDSVTYRARPALFEETELQIPQTFAELVDLVVGWPGERMERYPDCLPLMVGEVKRTLLSDAIQLSFLSQAVQGADYRFDSPLTPKPLSRVLAADTRALEYPEGDYGFMNKAAPISRTNYSLGVLTSNASMGDAERESPLALRPADDLPAVLPVRVAYLGIYAASDKQAAALNYLEAHLAALEHETRVKCYPDFDEPLELPGIQANLQRYDERIASLDQQIAGAEGAEQIELVAERDRQVADRAGQEAMRWRLSPEVIADYRADAKRRAGDARIEQHVEPAGYPLPHGSPARWAARPRSLHRRGPGQAALDAA